MAIAARYGAVTGVHNTSGADELDAGRGFVLVRGVPSTISARTGRPSPT
jgi:hypothetical protein